MTRGRLAAAVAVLLAGLGCSGTFSSAPEPVLDHRRSACEAWVAHVNGLEGCLHVTYDADNLCQGVDEQPDEIVVWFQCLADHSSCDGGEPRFDPDSCPPPVRLAEVQG
ncbi:MAG: hypothetical protein KC621_23140 [Myxococcales bacterium]|nr:hypothetical protein [Myxococcales bacterium]